MVSEPLHGGAGQRQPCDLPSSEASACKAKDGTKSFRLSCLLQALAVSPHTLHLKGSDPETLCLACVYEKEEQDSRQTSCTILLNVSLTGCMTLGKLLAFPELSTSPSSGEYWVNSHPGSSAEQVAPDSYKGQRHNHTAVILANGLTFILLGHLSSPVLRANLCALSLVWGVLSW